MLSGIDGLQKIEWNVAFLSVAIVFLVGKQPQKSHPPIHVIDKIIKAKTF